MTLNRHDVPNQSAPANRRTRPSPRSVGLRGLAGLLSCAVLAAFLGVWTVPVAAQDAPTGGGTGCKSHGNCQGTMYTDKSNLDRWWYRRCSGCHGATVAEPTSALKEPDLALRTVFADSSRFWRLHGQAQADPVLVRLLPKTRLKAKSTLAPEYQALMQRR